MSDHPALPTWPLPMDWAQAHQAERASRMEGHRRTAEAQDQINAARAQPTDAELEVQLSDAALRETPAVQEMGGIDLAMKEVDGAVREAVRELREAPTAYRVDTGGSDSVTRYEMFHRAIKDPHAVVLTGPEAERYRVLQAAARAARAASKAAQAAGTALRDAFQTFCAGGGGGG